MIRLLFVIAIILVVGWYVWKGSQDADHYSDNYSSKKTIEMINNLEPTAAGPKE